MDIEQAKEALEKDGFNVTIDTETDGLIELNASKEGFSETFYDSTLNNHCSNYLCEFDNNESLVKYANKSIELAKI